MGKFITMLNCLLEQKNVPIFLKYIFCYLIRVIISYPTIRYIKRDDDYCANNKINYYIDGWTNRESTFGQKRIEDELEKYANPESRLLHIGIGNSSLYRRYKLCKYIHGLTAIYQEWKHGTNYNDHKYNINLIDKNDYNSLNRILTKYDIIVDPHLKSYACCNYHFNLYFRNLIDSLNLHGIILTHVSGFNYHLKYGNANILTTHEIKSICNEIGVPIDIKINYKGVVTIIPKKINEEM